MGKRGRGRGASGGFGRPLGAGQRAWGALGLSRPLREVAASAGSETVPDPRRRRIDLLLEGGGLPIEGGTAHD